MPLAAAPTSVAVGDWSANGQMDIMLFTDNGAAGTRVSVLVHDALSVEAELGSVDGSPFVLDWHGDRRWTFLTSALGGAPTVYTKADGRLDSEPATPGLVGGTLCAFAPGGAQHFVDLNGDCLAGAYTHH